MPYDINATIERLEQNLKDLDSARKQVENTVNASNELRQTVNGYVETVIKLKNEILGWEEQLTHTQTGLSEQLEDAFSTLETSCDNISDGFKASTETTVKKFSDQNTILSQRVEELSTLRQELNSVMTELKTIKGSLTTLTTSVTESQKDQDRVLDQIKGNVTEIPVTVKGYTDDVMKQMNQRHEQLCQKLNASKEKIETIIQKADNLATLCSNTKNTCDNINSSCDGIKSSCNSIKASIDETKSSIASLEESISKSIRTNRVLLFIGFIILIVLHFVL